MGKHACTRYRHGFSQYRILTQRWFPRLWITEEDCNDDNSNADGGGSNGVFLVFPRGGKGKLI